MPFIKSLASECCAYIITLILLLGVIMPIYSYCVKKKLVYIIITALFSYQPSSYSKYIKLNIYSSCNIKSVSNAKYIFFLYIFKVFKVYNFFV